MTASLCCSRRKRNSADSLIVGFVRAFCIGSNMVYAHTTRRNAVSTVVYTFATMRKLALKKIEVPISGTGWWFGWGQKKETVELQGKHLVFAQDSDVSKTSSECQHLKRSIAASDIAKFIDLNFHLYSRFPDKEVNSRKGDALNTKAILDQFSKDEGELVEFDDEFNNNELVYAITINHTDKRVVVVFRGSVTDGRDWATNIDMPLRKIDTPPVLTASGFEEEVKVHRGFASKLTSHAHISILLVCFSRMRRH